MKAFWKTFLIVTLTVVCSIAMAAVLRAESTDEAIADEEEETAVARLVVPALPSDVFVLPA